MGNDLARLTAAVCSLRPPKRAPGRKKTRAVRPSPRGAPKPDRRVGSGSGSERIGCPIRSGRERTGCPLGSGTGAYRVSDTVRDRSGPGIRYGRDRSAPGIRYGSGPERTGSPLRSGAGAYRVSDTVRDQSGPGIRYGTAPERTGCPLGFGAGAYRVSDTVHDRSRPGIPYGSAPGRTGCPLRLRAGKYQVAGCNLHNAELELVSRCKIVGSQNNGLHAPARHRERAG